MKKTEIIFGAKIQIFEKNLRNYKKRPENFYGTKIAQMRHFLVIFKLMSASAIDCNRGLTVALPPRGKYGRVLKEMESDGRVTMPLG